MYMETVEVGLSVIQQSYGIIRHLYQNLKILLLTSQSFALSNPHFNQLSTFNFQPSTFNFQLKSECCSQPLTSPPISPAETNLVRRSGL